MKIGSVVLATDQGLGYLAKDFYAHGIINKVLIRPHGSRKSHAEWFDSGDVAATMDELLDGIDVLLGFETFFDWSILPKARARGIKTVLMPMYECTPWPFPYEPDLLICPSKLDLQYYEGKNAVFLPVPVNVKWKQRSHARIFVHNAGNGGLGGRNGTKEVILAMKHVKSPISLILRSQVPLFDPHWNEVLNDIRIDFKIGQLDHKELFAEGDVFLFPEKFNGLSLPLQEAYAAGMLVMAGNRFPINDWLPPEPLIPVDFYKMERIAREFKSAHYDPIAIATTMDAWYNKSITRYSLAGQAWAKQNSWKILKEKYLKVLSQ